MLENIGISAILSIGSIFGSIAFTWGYVRNKVENLTSENDNQWKVIEGLRSWKEDHERFIASMRLDIEQKIGSVKEVVGRDSSTLVEIYRRLGEIEKKIDRIDH